MKKLSFGQNRRPAQIRQLGLCERDSNSVRFSRRSELPLADWEQIEAAGTEVLQNLSFDPAMNTVLNALLIGPPGNRDRGVQIGDEAGLLHCAGEVISRGAIAIKLVLDVTFGSKNIALGVVA